LADDESAHGAGLIKKVAQGPPLREVYTLPADPEPAFTLTQTEYRILLEGEPLPAEDSIRWASFGAFIAGAGMLVALYYTSITPAELVANLAKTKATAPLVLYCALVVFTVISFGLFCMAWLRIRRSQPKQGSPYGFLKDRIEAHYRKPRDT
jgi:hypothetical protein